MKQEIISKIHKVEYELRSQIDRALISVILNIADGAYQDLSHFLNQSDTSVNEVISCLDLCLDDGYIDKYLHKKFSEKAEKLIA